MKKKEDQMYLGDLLSADGSHSKNVMHRKNKGLGVTNSIMQILQTTSYGKYYFEVALILRESLFLSSLLLNSEAWVNISDKDIRKLEHADKLVRFSNRSCGVGLANLGWHWSPFSLGWQHFISVHCTTAGRLSGLS